MFLGIICSRPFLKVLCVFGGMFFRPAGALSRALELNLNVSVKRNYRSPGGFRRVCYCVSKRFDRSSRDSYKFSL